MGAETKDSEVRPLEGASLEVEYGINRPSMGDPLTPESPGVNETIYDKGVLKRLRTKYDQLKRNGENHE